MVAKVDPVTDLVEEEEEEEWPEVGVQNIEEAEQYTQKINNVFDHPSALIHQDTKTALAQTIQNFKKIVVKQWQSMGDADVDIILRTIKDPTALYLRQHLMAGGIEVVDLPKELPSGEEFMRQLPEWARQAEEMAFITDIFSHAAQAHEHLSEVCANISALTKVTDKATLLLVINGAVCPLIQVNVPEGFLNPVEGKEGEDNGRGEERENLEDGAACPPMPLVLKHKPRNGLTHILTAAIWLQMSKKYFNKVIAKEACERFDVHAKQLSRVLTGKKYLGGTQACKHKATKEPPVRHKKSDG